MIWKERNETNETEVVMYDLVFTNGEERTLLGFIEEVLFRDEIFKGEIHIQNERSPEREFVEFAHGRITECNIRRGTLNMTVKSGTVYYQNGFANHKVEVA